MRFLSPALFVTTLSLFTAANAREVTLAEVLAGSGSGDSHAAANAELEALYAAKSQRASERGWQLTSSASTGYYNEIIDEDRRTEYMGNAFSVGVRYPLLGTLKRRVEAVAAAERDVRRAEYQRALAKAEHRLSLRSAYADWWRANEEHALCKGIDDAWRNAEQTIDVRLRGKWIRPSQADLIRSEWTSVRRRCALQTATLDDTRTVLQQLGATIEPNDVPVAAQLASKPAALQSWKTALDGNARVNQYKADLDNAQANRDQPWYAAINSEFALTAGRESRPLDTGRPGYGLSAGVTLSAPFDVMEYGKARGLEAEARYRAAEHALESERTRVVQEVAAVLSRLHRALDEFAWRDERKGAVDEILREERQRGGLNGEGGTLQLSQAEVDHYNANFARIAAWHAAWIEESALRVFEDSSDDPLTALLGATDLHWQAPMLSVTGDLQPGWTVGTYVWESEALLSSKTRAAQLDALARAGIGVVHVGLTGVQIARGQVTLQQLQQLLADAHRRSIKVTLLLGDPSWLRPQHRNELMEIIARYKALPFDALHLDLEVEQLGWPVPDQRLRDWLDTLVLAKQKSPWPLMISSHPRWFNDMADRGPCVPCEVSKQSLADVVLMIYTRNPQRSADTAAAISRRWPRIEFRLAQSLEPDQPADLTWHDSTASELAQQATAWRSRFQSSSVKGLDWQSWSYYPGKP